jgi:hypothetical protein
MHCKSFNWQTHISPPESILTNLYVKVRLFHNLDPVPCQGRELEALPRIARFSGAWSSSTSQQSGRRAVYSITYSRALNLIACLYLHTLIKVFRNRICNRQINILIPHCLISAVQCSAVQCSAVQCSAVQYSTV